MQASMNYAVAVMLALAAGGCRGRLDAPPARQDPTAGDLATTQKTAVIVDDEDRYAFTVPSGYQADVRSEVDRAFSKTRPAPSVLGGWIAASTTVASLSIDIPKLPLHVPGLIPLPLVVDGYLDDLRSQHRDLTVVATEAATIASGKAHRVRSVWSLESGAQTEEAFLTVHADRVYIFRLGCAAADYAQHRAALESLVNSVQWLD